MELEGINILLTINLRQLLEHHSAFCSVRPFPLRGRPAQTLHFAHGFEIHN
jgi:hypothetical protein